MRVIAILGACAALLLPAGVAQAQSGPGVQQQGAGQTWNPHTIGAVAETPSRMERSRAQMNAGRERRRNMDELPEDLAVIMAETQVLMERSGQPCEVTDAMVVGRGARNRPVYEAVCSDGMGYVVADNAYPEPIECGALAEGTGHRDRLPDGVVVNECALPGNEMTVDRIAAYAGRAGVPCHVSQGAQIGRTNSGAVFEVACDEGDGFWVRPGDTGWVRENCMKVEALNDTCRFTTPRQRAAALSARLGSTPAANCDVQEVGYVGAAGRDEFYEVRCRAGDGYVIHVDADENVRRALTCTQAQASLGAACRLGG